MSDDEKAIRQLVEAWMTASKAGDTATVLGLMSDDVVFMVPGKPPFGKEAFAASSKAMRGVLLQGTSDIQEIKVLGDWAWMRNKLRVVVTPPNGQPMAHAGFVLTILHKKSDGKWVIARDANLLVPEKTD